MVMFAGGAAAKPVDSIPYIVCGAISPGSATVGWVSGDNTAYGGVSGFATTCGATRLVYFSWNGGPWTTQSTLATSPGQSGTLSVQVGDSDMNYCDPTVGLNCNYGASTGWTNPNSGGGTGGGTGGGGPGSCTFTAFSSNTPVMPDSSTILYYTESGCSTITVSPGSTFSTGGASGSFTYNAGVKTNGSTITYTITGTNSAGTQGNSLSTSVVTQQPVGDCTITVCPELGGPDYAGSSAFTSGYDEIVDQATGLPRIGGLCAAIPPTGAPALAKSLGAIRTPKYLIDCEGLDIPIQTIVTVCLYKNFLLVANSCSSTVYSHFSILQPNTMWFYPVTHQCVNNNPNVWQMDLRIDSIWASGSRDIPGHARSAPYTMTCS